MMITKKFEVELYNDASGESRSVEVEAKNAHDAECEANEFYEGFCARRVKECHLNSVKKA